MVIESTFYRFTSVVNVFRCWETMRKKKKINHLQLGITKLFWCAHNNPRGLSRQ